MPAGGIVSQTRVFGIRHHGPGSARSLVAALQEFDPEIVVIEGPADADPLMVHCAGLTPPIALSAWEVGNPRRSAFWPFAIFSPEWQAMDWALSQGREVRFMDLPTSLSLACSRQEEESVDGASGADSGGEVSADTSDEGGAAPTSDSASAVTGPSTLADPTTPPADPITLLARAAGHDDPETWWEDLVEQRASRAQRAPASSEESAFEIFDAIAEAMTAVRKDHEDDPQTLLREAHMRKILRPLARSFERIAVVCGAYHVPALQKKVAASADNALLKGLPKVKTQITWVPWSHGRLSQARGYGAGVASPGWYHHLFTAPDHPIERWFTHVGKVLRDNDLPTSSAHVIEGVRLAQTLAAVRGRPHPGLSEIQESTLAVLCEGSDLALDLVTREAVVGDLLGAVPDEVPRTPFETDMTAQAKTLRVKQQASEKTLTLDLRKDLDLQRSHFLRRLAILDVYWGVPGNASSTGTFKEEWRLRWEPELAINVVEASRWGTTVASAATARLLDATDTLADVTAGVRRSLLAHLPEALETLLGLLDERAAQTHDVGQLLQALPELVRAQRYGDVRKTNTEHLGHIISSLIERICAGLGPALGGISDDEAVNMVRHINGVESVMSLLDEDIHDRWYSTVNRVSLKRNIPPLISGRLVRILSNAGRISSDDLRTRMSLYLSGGHTPADQALWAEGLLTGSSLLLIHSPGVLRVLDQWIIGLSQEHFLSILPPLRRAFGDWDAPERRAIATKVKNLDSEAGGADNDDTVDLSVVSAAMATIDRIVEAAQ